MKIEPRKTAALPKYAAVLASAVLLTGCGIDVPVATDGTAPAPDPEVELVGEEAFFPDLTETPAQTTEPMLEGEINPYDIDGCVTDCPTETTTVLTQPEPQVAGMIQVAPDPVMLDGDVGFVPEFQPESPAELLDSYAVIYQSVFAERGVTMTKSSRTVNWFGMRFTEGLKSVQQKTQVIFFDGTAAESAGSGRTLHQWLQDYYSESYDWGGVLLTDDPDAEYTRVIFIDVMADADPVMVARNAGL